MNTMTEALAPYRTSFPVSAPESAHWTERVVTEGHLAACREYGHATWTVDGVDQGRCPRCGATKAPRPATTCDEMRRLDAIFDTDPASPLHHDNRCTAHAAPAPTPVTARTLRPCYCDSAFHPKGC